VTSGGPSTTIFIYYDDCGCFYDHVKPPADRHLPPPPPDAS
jgi:phospholipase C